MHEPFDHGRNTACRNRDPPSAQAKAPVRPQNFNGAQGGFVIIERLAHAHENNVGHLFILMTRNLGNLFHDLAGRQITAEWTLSAGTKRTPNAASELSRYANGSSAALDDQDAFQNMAVHG